MKKNIPKPGNVDIKTVEGFGDEWTAFDQGDLPETEQERIFSGYFSLFPWESLPKNSEGFDLGCGSGRWAALAARRVGRLHCIDASQASLDVARQRLRDVPNVSFHLSSVDSIPLENNSQDFGYSIGVLHHVPDTQRGLASCVEKLKAGSPFLVYLYYRFDNRPTWYGSLWRAADTLRRIVSKLPFWLRRRLTDTIAVLVYWPVARSAKLRERLGADVETWPLAAYRDCTLYTMRTDALDRFGTRLEQRFTRQEIESMMRQAGLSRIRFREGTPYWVAIGWRESEKGDGFGD